MNLEGVDLESLEIGEQWFKIMTLITRKSPIVQACIVPGRLHGNIELKLTLDKPLNVDPWFTTWDNDVGYIFGSWLSEWERYCEDGEDRKDAYRFDETSVELGITFVLSSALSGLAQDLATGWLSCEYDGERNIRITAEQCKLAVIRNPTPFLESLARRMSDRVRSALR